MQLLPLFASQNCVARNKAQKSLFSNVFTSIKLICWWLESRTDGILRRTDDFFRKNRRTIPEFQLYRSKTFAMRWHFPGAISMNHVLHMSFFSIETIIAAIEKIVFRRIESNGQNMWALPDNFSVSSFRSQNQNTIIRGWVAYYRYKNVDREGNFKKQSQ